MHDRIMVNYFRLWLPVSFVAHLILLLVVRSMPASVVPMTNESYMRVTMSPWDTHVSLKAVSPVKPLSLHRPQPKLATKQITYKMQNHPPIAVGKSTTVPPIIAKQKSFTVPSSAGGGFIPPENITPLNLPSGTANKNAEGWADTPAKGIISLSGAPGNSKIVPKYASTIPFGGNRQSGSVDETVALRPGIPSPTNLDAGGAGGSYGGMLSPFAGTAIADAQQDGLSGITPSVMTGHGETWVDQPGRPGGAGLGPNGMMGNGPKRPGHQAGINVNGPAGTTMAVNPGGAGHIAEAGSISPGGALGKPGIPLGGIGGGGLPNGIGDAPGAPSAVGNGHPLDWSDHPGAGIGPGIGTAKNGVGIGQPTYGTSAIAGPEAGYPKVAIEEGVSGTVILDITVNTNGHYAKHSYVSRSISDMLDNEAVRTAKKWTYRIAMLNGKPKTSTIRMTVNYLAIQKTEIFWTSAK